MIHTPPGSRYIEGEVSTWENFSYPVLAKVLEKDIPILENQCTKSLILIPRRAFMINVTYSGKL